MTSTERSVWMTRVSLVFLLAAGLLSLSGCGPKKVLETGYQQVQAGEVVGACRVFRSGADRFPNNSEIAGLLAETCPQAVQQLALRALSAREALDYEAAYRISSEAKLLWPSAAATEIHTLNRDAILRAAREKWSEGRQDEAVELTVLANRYAGQARETAAWTTELARGLGEQGLELARAGDYAGAQARVAVAARLPGQSAVTREYETNILRLRAQQMMTLSKSLVREGQPGRAHALQFTARKVLGGQADSDLLQSVVDANSVSVSQRANGGLGRDVLESVTPKLQVELVRWTSSSRADARVDVSTSKVRCSESASAETRTHNYLAGIELQSNPEWLRLDGALVQNLQAQQAEQERRAGYNDEAQRSRENVTAVKRRLKRQTARFDAAKAKRDAAQASLDKASDSLQEARQTLARLLAEEGANAEDVERARAELAAAVKAVAALYAKLADPKVEDRSELETALMKARVRRKRAGEALERLASVVKSAQVVEVRKRIALALELVDSKTELLDIERVAFRSELKKRRGLRQSLRAANAELKAAESALSEIAQRLEALYGEARGLVAARDQQPRELEVEVYADWPYEVTTWRRTCRLNGAVEVSSRAGVQSVLEETFSNETTDVSWSGDSRVGLIGDSKSYPTPRGAQGDALIQSFQESTESALRSALLRLRAQRLDELLAGSDPESAAARATLLWFLKEDDGSQMQRIAEKELER